MLGKIGGVGGDATADLQGGACCWSPAPGAGQECFYDKAATDGKTPRLRCWRSRRLFYEEVKTALASPPLNEHLEVMVGARGQSPRCFRGSLPAARWRRTTTRTSDPPSPALDEPTELHAAHRMTKNTGGISVHCVGAVATLRDAVDEQLRRAQRDNECVYMVRVPAYEDVAPLGAAAVVKAVRPPAEAVDAATEDMFAAIVPESGFKALSRYTEKVDALIREENDVLALAATRPGRAPGDELRSSPRCGGWRAAGRPGLRPGLGRRVGGAPAADERWRRFRARAASPR